MALGLLLERRIWPKAKERGNLQAGADLLDEGFGLNPKAYPCACRVRLPPRPARAPTLNAEQERSGAVRAQREAGRRNGAAGLPKSRRGEVKEGSSLTG